MASGVNTDCPGQDGDTIASSSKEAFTSLFEQEWKTLRNLYPASYVNTKNLKSKESSRSVSVPLKVNKDTSLVLHFHLTEKYPFHIPDISIDSKVLSKSEISDIVKSLDMICVNSIGQPMLKFCVDETISLLQDFIEDKKEIKTERKKRKKKKKMKEVGDEIEDTDRSRSNFNDIDNGITDYLDVPGSHSVLSCYAVKNDQHSFELSTPACDTNSKPPRPNYFVALRICNENLIQNLTKIQESLVEKEVLLTKGVIPSSAFHVTLCNLGLDKADDLLAAMEALRKMKAVLQTVLPTSPLVIHGASQFYDRAIYAKVKRDEEFLAFRGILIEKLTASGIEFREDHEQYTPHVTLIKVRRPERKLFGNRPIHPKIYSSFLESVHGEQIVDAIYLCAMDGNKREDGFYVTPYELQFEGR